MTDISGMVSRCILPCIQDRTKGRSIWGIKEEVEYDISIETRKIATINPTTQYIQDSTLPAGKEVVKQAGSNGSKVEAYKVMKKDGQVVSSTLLSRDTYNAKKRIVRVGTGEQQ